jgi:HK97 family phage portal protein
LSLFHSLRSRGVKGSFQDYIRRFLSGEDISPDEEQFYSKGNLDTETAMKYTAVFACIRVLSETFAVCPIMLYRKNKDGTRDTANDLAIYSVLHDRPNEEMAPFNFKEMCMMNMNSGGNVYAEKLYNRLGEIVGLYPYRWENVRMDRRQSDKRLVYYIRDGTPTESDAKTRDQIFHVPGMSFDGINGLSPISYAAGAVTLGMSYEEFGKRFYRNGALASGAFSKDGELGDTAYERLKKDLGKNYSGLLNAGKPLLLEGGLKFTPFTINPVDAQLIESKRFQIEDIARIYRVPMHLIQDLTRSTNNNIEHQSLEFIMYTMLPHFKRWEENINMQLLNDKERQAGYYVEFKIDTLLRGDALSRAQAYAQGRQWGWLSVNDIRKLENMPPITNGDRYLEPVNMVEAGSNPNTQAAQQKLIEDIYKMITEKGAA